VSVTSVRSRASGSAWIGFDEERKNVTSPGSPAWSTMRPSRTATACTWWTASTSGPRRTVTLIGSMEIRA
jgi:hypothetical protein